MQLGSFDLVPAIVALLSGITLSGVLQTTAWLGRRRARRFTTLHLTNAMASDALGTTSSSIQRSNPAGRSANERCENAEEEK